MKQKYVTFADNGKKTIFIAKLFKHPQLQVTLNPKNATHKLLRKKKFSL